ncbi:hypothetical protein FAP59_17585 [Morganella morganii]|nr:hypothetical protein [Morganella morganii]
MSHSADLTQTPTNRRYRLVRQSVIIASVLVLVGLLLTFSFSLLSVVDVQGQRLEQLAQRLEVAELKNADLLSPGQWEADLGKMRTKLDDLSGMQAVLSDNIGQTERRLDSLSQQIRSSSDHGQDEQIKQLQTRQAQFEQTLQTIEKRLTLSVSGQNTLPKSPGSAGTKQTHRVTPVATIAKKSPFQLMAIEYRGGRAFAALMPAGANQLKQVGLRSEGQQYQGWTVTQIQSERVQLQRQGHVMTLRLP